MPAIYPGPALPNVLVQRITPELVQELVHEGLTAGVRNGADLGQPGVADAPTTRITVVTAGGAQIVTANALSQAQSDDPRLTAAQRQARAKLAAYEKKLTGLTTRQGMPQATAYQPDAVAVFATPYTAPTGMPASPAKAWPGPALPGSDIDAATKAGCVAVTGAQKDKVLAAAKAANSATPWTVGSTKWHVVFRPLLPDESGCAAVKGTGDADRGTFRPRGRRGPGDRPRRGRRARAGTGGARPGPAGLPSSAHCTPSRSTTKMRVSFGLITPPAPRAP